MMDDAGSLNSMESTSMDPPTPRVYSRRWLVLTAFTLVNISNGMLWISFASIADITATYYKTNDFFVNLLALVFPVAAAICGVLVSSLLLKINLRANMTMCAIANVLAAGLRALSAAPVTSFSPLLRQVLVMSGQIFAAIAQPFIMFSSTTLAAEWFAENQRAIANTAASMANPLGIMLANLISPAMAKSSDDMFKLSLFYCGPAALCLLSVIVGITKSKPPTPPTLTRNALVQPQGGAFTSLRDSMSICVKSKHFLLLTWGFSVGMGMFTALSTFMEQMLCPVGYNNSFAGLAGALLIASGLIMSAIVGVIVDRTGAFNETVKLCFAFASISVVLFFVVVGIKNMEVLILLSIILSGAFAFACYPVALELGAEITYPASETVSSGLLIQGGQIMSVIMILIAQFTATDINPIPSDSACEKDTPPQDFRIPGYILSGLMVATTFPLVLIFRGEYRRRRAENNMLHNDTETVSE